MHPVRSRAEGRPRPLLSMIGQDLPSSVRLPDYVTLDMSGGLRGGTVVFLTKAGTSGQTGVGVPDVSGAVWAFSTETCDSRLRFNLPGW